MRLIKLSVIAVIATTFIGQAALSAGPTPQQVLSNVRKTYSSLRSLEIKGTSTETLTFGKDKKSTSAKYTVLYKKPSKLKHEVVQSGHRSMIVTDGKNVYTYQAKAKEYRKAPLKGGLKDIAGIGGPGVNTILLLSGTDFSKGINKPKIVANQVVAGVDSYVLQFSVGKSEGALQKIWVGKKDWLIRKNEITLSRQVKAKTKTGVKTDKMVSTSTATVSSIRPNASISDSAFVFKAPKGVTQFDPKKAAAAQMKQIEGFGNSLHGKSAPAIALTDVAGDQVNLSSLKGKVVLVDFWSVRSPVAAKQMAMLQKIYAGDREKGLEIVGISADPKDAIKSFGSKTKLTFPLATGDPKTLQQIATSYKVVGVPTIYVINRSGNVTTHFVGTPSEASVRASLKKAGL